MVLHVQLVVLRHAFCALQARKRTARCTLHMQMLSAVSLQLRAHQMSAVVLFLTLLYLPQGSRKS